MSNESISDLEEENTQLKEELRVLRDITDGSKAMGFVNLISRYFVIGRNVSESTENLIRTYKRKPFAVHDRQIAEVVSAIVKRMVIVYGLGILLAAMPACALVYQSYLLSKQTKVQLKQFDELTKGQVAVQSKDLELGRITEAGYESRVTNGGLAISGRDLLKTQIEEGPFDPHIPGSLLRVVISNTSAKPVVLREMSLTIEEDGALRFAIPTEPYHTVINGTPIDKLGPEIVFLNPGIGGRDGAAIRVPIDPRGQAEIRCYFPLPIVSSCLLYTSPSPRDQRGSRMPSSA